MTWTAASVATLSEMWLEDMHVALIAQKLEVTRNAVIGKAHRLGLPEHKHTCRTRRIWLAPVEAKLIALNKEKKSPSEIAKELNKTVSAVQSKLIRLGLCHARKPPIDWLRQKPRGPQRPRHPLRSANPLTGKAWQPLTTSRCIPLGELTTRRCAWPLGEPHRFYCGLPVYDRSYCRCHYGLSVRDAA